MNSAELCRKNGWVPGTVIEGRLVFDRVETWDRIVITAIGEAGILGKLAATKRGTKGWQERKSGETYWNLAYRDWRKSEGGEAMSGSTNDLTIEEAVKILNDRRHVAQRWEIEVHGSCAKVLTVFEALAIAREYLRADSAAAEADGQ